MHTLLFRTLMGAWLVLEEIQLEYEIDPGKEQHFRPRSAQGVFGQGFFWPRSTNQFTTWEYQNPPIDVSKLYRNPTLLD